MPYIRHKLSGCWMWRSRPAGPASKAASLPGGIVLYAVFSQEHWKDGSAPYIAVPLANLVPNEREILPLHVHPTAPMQRSHAPAISSGSWVMMRTVFSFRISRISAAHRSRLSASCPAVGSSSMTIGLSDRYAIISVRRCICPPEREKGCRLRQSHIIHTFQQRFRFCFKLRCHRMAVLQFV